MHYARQLPFEPVAVVSAVLGRWFWLCSNHIWYHMLLAEKEKSANRRLMRKICIQRK